jgi:hypothetical protein
MRIQECKNHIKNSNKIMITLQLAQIMYNCSTVDFYIYIVKNTFIQM